MILQILNHFRVAFSVMNIPSLGWHSICSCLFERSGIDFLNLGSLNPWIDIILLRYLFGLIVHFVHLGHEGVQTWIGICSSIFLIPLEFGKLGLRVFFILLLLFFMLVYFSLVLLHRVEAPGDRLGRTLIFLGGLKCHVDVFAANISVILFLLLL